MTEQVEDDDRMPSRFSPEFEEIAERIMKLSAKDVCDLLGLVGIKFPGTSREKLEGDPKDRLVLYLDEADSRNKVEQFLVTIQV